MICKGRLWRWASLSMRAPLGNLEGGSFTSDLCVEDGSDDGISLHRGPVGEPGGGSVYWEL